MIHTGINSNDLLFDMIGDFILKYGAPTKIITNQAYDNENFGYDIVVDNLTGIISDTGLLDKTIYVVTNDSDFIIGYLK